MQDIENSSINQQDSLSNSDTTEIQKTGIYSDSLTKWIQTKSFKLMVPEHWELRELQGIDSYVGKIGGNRDSLRFDQGYLSFSGIHSIKKDDNSIYYEEVEIGGLPSIIEKRLRTSKSPYEGQPDIEYTTLTAYIGDSTSARNRLYINNPKKEGLFMQVFKTHQFLRK